MNLFGVGPLEILIILMVAFIVLGPNRLIDVARNFGKTMRELRNATGQFSRMLEDDPPPDPPQGPPPDPPRDDQKDREQHP